MAKISKKAAQNKYYQARLKAAQTNEQLSSRDGASELTLISEDRLGSIEVGDVDPRPDEVLNLAKAYRMPEMANQYCAEICPLGQEIKMPLMKPEDLDRTVMRILGLLIKFNADELRNRLTLIAEDGKITEDEDEEFSEVLSILGELSDSVMALKFWARIHGKSDSEPKSQKKGKK